MEGQNQRYSVSDWQIRSATDEELEKWATDPNCKEQEKCVASWSERRAKRDAARIAKQEALLARREALRENPFDPRTEVSADARHLVKHLWILFVLFPIVLGVLLGLLAAIGVVK
jgi:hypothetical protein